MCFGLGRKGTVRCPQVDEGLHGLQLRRLEHVNLGGCKDEMAETTIQMFVEIQVIERIHKVSPIEMRIDSKHLPKDGLADVDEFLGKAAALTDPVARTNQLCKRGAEVGRSCRDRILLLGSETTGCVRVGCNLRTRGVVSKRHASAVCREDVCVISLACDPPLHQRDVFMSRDFNRFLFQIQPGERMTPKSQLAPDGYAVARCHIPAGRHAITCSSTTDGFTFRILVMDDSDKVPEIPIVLHN